MEVKERSLDSIITQAIQHGSSSDRYSDTATAQGSLGEPCDQESNQSEPESRKPINWHVKPYDLPPCRVCGARGTGFHYGVNTCEACKTFFSRASKNPDKLTCKNSSKCEMSPSNSSLCAKCRYTKCLEAGMSTKGIKFGRYSFDKIVRDTREVKLRKAKESEDNINCVDEFQAAAIAELTSSILEAGRKYLTQARSLDHTFAIEFHALTLRGTHRSKNIFEGMHHVLKDVMQVLEGDQRLEVYNKMFALIAHIIQTLVKFAKMIPGFRQLPMEDQISLFKGSLLDMRFLMMYPVIDVKTGTLDNTFDIMKAMGGNIGERAVKLASRLQQLNLTEDEVSLLVALVLFMSDRCELTSREEVSDIHDNILHSLQHSFNTHHQSDPLLFARLISALTEIRSFGTMAREFFKEVIQKNEGRGVVEVPTIMLEMFCGDCSTPQEENA